MTGIIAVLFKGMILQPVLALAVMTLYLLFLLHTAPYQFKSHDRMAFLSLTTICINLFVTVLIALESRAVAINANTMEEEKRVLDRDAIVLGLIILNCTVGAIQILVMICVDCRSLKTIDSTKVVPNENNAAKKKEEADRVRNWDGEKYMISRTHRNSRSD